MSSYNPVWTRIQANMPIKDRTIYPKCWHQISRYIRNVRAGGRCEWCGACNYETHPVTGSSVVLTVAHLDQNPKNNHLDNLAALCQRCHLAHDRDHHLRAAKATRYAKKYRHQLKLIGE